MASLINGDGFTNGLLQHSQPETPQVEAQLRTDDVSTYLFEALKLTLGATREELERDGGPLAQSEAASTIERFQTFLVGARTAFYAQKVEAASQQDCKIRFV